MKRTSKYMLYLFLWYTLINAANGIFAPYISLYYLQKGFSVFQIGVLAAMAPVAILLIQPLWALLSDRINNRTLIMRIITIGSGLSVMLYLFGNSFYGIILITFLYYSFFTSMMPLSESHMLSYTMQENKKFGLLRLGGTLGFGAITPIAGRILNDSNIQLIFYAVPVVCLLIFANLALIPKVENKTASKGLFKGGVLDILRNVKVIKVLIITFILFVALSFHNTFISVYITEMNYSSTMIGIGFFIQCVVEIPVLLYIDRFMKKYSVIHIMLFAGILLGFRLLLYYLARDILLIFVGQALSGITLMTLIYCSIVFMGQETPEHLRSTGQSLRAIVGSGLSSIVGSIGGGFFSKTFGIRQSYLIVAVFVLVTCMVFALLEYRKNTAVINIYYKEEKK